MPAILLDGVTKRYGSLAAVSNLSLSVEEGEILGFLGLNGAGKTTTIRILLDLLRPSSGRASIFGHDCQRDGLRARAHVGYLPAEFGVYAELTGGDVLDLFAKLDGRAVNPSYARDLRDRLAFPESDLGRKVREYSSGMKRKLGILQAFQSDPALLILDEPTEGLDPLMQDAFYGLLTDVQRRGRTVFFSSHVLSEVERVCHRLALLRKGELVLLSSVDECRKLAARRVRVVFHADVPAPGHLPAGVRLLDSGPHWWSLQVEGPMAPLLREFALLPVEDLHISEAKLEDAVLGYYRDSAA